MTIYIYRVDVSEDANFGDLCGFIQKYEGSMKVISAIGPGGGNPFVEFRFRKPMQLEDLRAFNLEDEPHHGADEIVNN